jgi:hypothetical protein
LSPQPQKRPGRSFNPFPILTILLLNRDRAELAKRHEGSSAVWLTDPRLRAPYQAAYRRLPAEMQGLPLGVLQADAAGYFDLQAIAGQVRQGLEPGYFPRLEPGNREPNGRAPFQGASGRSRLGPAFHAG